MKFTSSFLLEKLAIVFQKAVTEKNISILLLLQFLTFISALTHILQRNQEIFWGNKLQRDVILKEDVNQSKSQDAVLW